MKAKPKKTIAIDLDKRLQKLIRDLATANQRIKRLEGAMWKPWGCKWGCACDECL
jgi:hypothetical protein